MLWVEIAYFQKKNYKFQLLIVVTCLNSGGMNIFKTGFWKLSLSGTQSIELLLKEIQNGILQENEYDTQKKLILIGLFGLSRFRRNSHMTLTFNVFKTRLTFYGGNGTGSFEENRLWNHQMLFHVALSVFSGIPAFECSKKHKVWIEKLSAN